MRQLPVLLSRKVEQCEVRPKRKRDFCEIVQTNDLKCNGDDQIIIDAQARIMLENALTIALLSPANLRTQS